MAAKKSAKAAKKPPAAATKDQAKKPEKKPARCGAIAAALLAALAGFALADAGVTTRPIVASQRDRRFLSERINATLEHATVREAVFESQGVRCHAWVFAPTSRGPGPVPVVVMGHGFAGQKDQGLARYADAFAAAGLASFAIDYRTFGGSGGEPRHVVDPPAHAQDFVAAALHVLGGADPALRAAGVTKRSKLGIWGSSMGGGHAIVAAAALGDLVGAVVSQMPMLDGFANSKFNIATKGVAPSLRLGLAALHDMARARFGFAPARVPAYAPLGSLGVMNLPDDELASWISKHPADRRYLGDWRNEVCARTLLAVKDYRPLLLVPGVSAPILFIRPGNDIVLPNDVVLEAAALARHPNSTLYQLAPDVGHFHLYREAFPEASRVQAAFLVGALS